jgi:hypothetical protein
MTSYQSVVFNRWQKVSQGPAVEPKDSHFEFK